MGAPPASQIPGLSDLSDQPSEETPKYVEIFTVFLKIH